LDSLSEFHPCATATEPDCRSSSNSLAPSEVCSPLAFSQPRGATYLRRFPTRRLRCALRVSHPLDALLPARPAELISSRSHPWGSPIEAFTLERCRTPSQTPLPSWGSDFASAEAPPAPPGIEHIARRPNREHWGLTRTPASLCLLELFSPPRPLAHRIDVAGCGLAMSPHAFSRRALRADLVVDAPGYRMRSTQPFSLETGAAPMGFLTSWPFSPLGLAAGLGYGFPSETGTCCQVFCLVFACCRSPYRSR
jgi:hypothetical protein